MRSAKRRARIEKKKKQKNFYGSVIRVLLPVAIILGMFLFIRLNTHFWNGRDKLTLTYRMANGDIGVTVVDPVLGELTTLIIPGDTSVSVARDYGTMRIKNVWQLGINENVGGNLLAESVTRNFLFPVFLWSNSEAYNLTTGNLAGIIHFIFSPGAGNVPFGDRISIGLFALRVDNLGKTEIDLGKSQFLNKKILNDGAPGYVISGPISQRLTAYFSDNQMASVSPTIDIVDATGSYGVADNVGQVLEVMGGKVVSIDRKVDREDFGCVVYGQNTDYVKKISRLFSCKEGKNKVNFDLEIDLGSSFTKIY